MNTMQEEFDEVVKHLYKQGRPAQEDGTCKYRTADGLMCAVGCRIPDDMYKPEMDTASGGSGLRNILPKFEFPVEVEQYQDLFSSLQGIHDGWSDWQGSYLWSDMEDELMFCADRYNLTYNAPDNVI
jgi:hypothetical protein